MNAHFTLVLDRNESLRLLADHFAARPGVEFTAPHNTENLRLDEFNQTQLTGTLFEEIATAVGTTGKTFGTLCDLLGITQYDAHQIGCTCTGEVVMGAEVARRLRSLMA